MLHKQQCIYSSEWQCCTQPTELLCVVLQLRCIVLKRGKKQKQHVTVCKDVEISGNQYFFLCDPASLFAQSKTGT